jgi:hypothetical protein
MGIDHRGANITMTEQFLDGANVVIRLQQMAGIAVAQRMCTGPLAQRDLPHCLLDRLLHMGFVQMKAAVLARVRNLGQGLRREEPLPHELLGRVLVLQVQRTREKGASRAGREVLPVQAGHLLKLQFELSCDVTPRIRRPRARDGVRPAGIKQRERSCRRWQL